MELYFLSELQTDDVLDKLQGLMSIFLYAAVLKKKYPIDGINSPKFYVDSPTRLLNSSLALQSVFPTQ